MRCLNILGKWKKTLFCFSGRFWAELAIFMHKSQDCSYWVQTGSGSPQDGGDESLWDDFTKKREKSPLMTTTCNTMILWFIIWDCWGFHMAVTYLGSFYWNASVNLLCTSTMTFSEQNLGMCPVGTYIQRSIPYVSVYTQGLVYTISHVSNLTQNGSVPCSVPPIC